MNKQVGILVLVSLIFYNFQCGKEEICPNQEQQTGSIKVNITPENKDYSDGDTIWITAIFDTDIELAETSQPSNVGNGFGRIGLLIMKFTRGQGARLVNKGYSDFDIIELIGTLDQSSIRDTHQLKYRGSISFNCDTEYCEFSIGLIPKDSGYYCIGLESGWIYNGDTSTCPTYPRLQNNSFDITSYNRDLYQELNGNNQLLLPRISVYQSFHVVNNDAAFTFRVR